MESSANWIRDVDRMVTSYKNGMYTPRECQAIAVDLMPYGGAAELIAHLPEDVVGLLRELAIDSASWSDATWESLISVNGPLPTPEDNREYRRKLDELRMLLTR